MTPGAPRWAAQDGFGVRLSWGPQGITALRDVAVLVLVDVLRFCTALDVATARGAAVRPAAWPHTQRPAGGTAGGPADGTAAGVEVADGSGPRRLNLSPGSLVSLGPGDEIVLPSANGSHCSTLASGGRAVVVGACLRNAAAAARHAERVAGTRPVAVVPCGEVWPGGGLRPAVEDLLGAGAVVAELAERRTCAPEAAAALAAFAACPDLAQSLAESESGRELRQRGRADDVVWAAGLNVSTAVAVLGADGAYRSSPTG